MCAETSAGRLDSNGAETSLQMIEVDTLCYQRGRQLAPRRIFCGPSSENCFLFAAQKNRDKGESGPMPTQIDYLEKDERLGLACVAAG